MRELYRCLVLLHEEEPATYRHLKAFYTAETRVARVRKRKDVPVQLRESTPVRFTFEPSSRCYSFREQIVPPWVRLALVEQGTDFVCEHFRGEPSLPNEFMGQVAPARPGAPVRAG